jgi:tight adherence protein B
MLTLLVLVFFAVFAVSALLLTASRSGASKQTEQTMTVLHAALATGNRATVDQIVDIRKEELLSAVPLLNRWLLRLEIAPRLRTLLYQADLNWTAGGLILMSIACFLIPAYLLYLRTGVVIFSLLIGVLLGAHLSSCSTSEHNASTSLNKVYRTHLI